MPNDAFKVPHGKSILRKLEEQLDTAYAEFIRTDKEFHRGICQGLAQAIAEIKTPYRPNVKTVKLEAKARYKNG